MTAAQFAKGFGYMPKRLARRVVRGLRSAAQRGKGLVVEEIDAAQPFPAVDRGELRSSVAVDTLDDGAQLYVDAPHAVFVEEGTRPHTPPLGALVAWVLRKRFTKDDAEALRIARAVQRKIAESGTAPRWFFRKAMVRLAPIVHAEIRRELAEDGASPSEE